MGNSWSRNCLIVSILYIQTLILIVYSVLLLFYVERYERLTVDTKGNEKGAETLKEKSPLIINN